MTKVKRSPFIDIIGTPKPDLRTKPRCPICGVLVTRENFGMNSTSWEDGWTAMKYYCHDCFLKPEFRNRY